MISSHGMPTASSMFRPSSENICCFGLCPRRRFRYAWRHSYSSTTTTVWVNWCRQT